MRPRPGQPSSPVSKAESQTGGDRATRPDSSRSSGQVVLLSVEQQAAIDLRTERVAFGASSRVTSAPGRVAPDENQYAFITPRAAGVVRSVTAPNARTRAVHATGDDLVGADERLVAAVEFVKRNGGLRHRRHGSFPQVGRRGLCWGRSRRRAGHTFPPLANFGKPANGDGMGEPVEMTVVGIASRQFWDEMPE